MTKQEAKRIAHRIAYRFVQQAIDVGGGEARTEEDQAKVDKALDEIAQYHFQRSEKGVQ